MATAAKKQHGKAPAKHTVSTASVGQNSAQASHHSLQDEWDEQLQTPHSKELLAAMATQALKEHHAGKTERGGFGK